MNNKQVYSIAVVSAIFILCLIFVSSIVSASPTITEARVNKIDMAKVFTYSTVKDLNLKNSTVGNIKYTVKPFPSDKAGASINGEKVRGTTTKKHAKKSNNYIITGQTKIHSVYVDSGANFLEVDLDWGSKEDQLRLSSYTPSGSKLPTYSDRSDERVDGRIHISISPVNGSVEQGTWMFKIYGENVDKKKNYRFNLYQH